MIKAINISKQFQEHQVLSDVSCTLVDGASYAIIGKSGAGKSTFLNILGGLEQPTSGSVEVNQVTLSPQTVTQLRRDVFGFIFQNFGLLDTASIEQNLAVGLANQKQSKKQARVKMQSVLSQVGLEYLNLGQKVYTLSGGEQQRIALARIILKQPQIVFADEPTGSLDPENAQAILHHLLHDFAPNSTILIATHDPNVWSKCDYLIKVQDHQINIVDTKEGEK